MLKRLIQAVSSIILADVMRYFSAVLSLWQAHENGAQVSKIGHFLDHVHPPEAEGRGSTDSLLPAKHTYNKYIQREVHSVSAKYQACSTVTDYTF